MANIFVNVPNDSIPAVTANMSTANHSAAAGRHGEPTAQPGDVAARRAAFQAAYPNSPTRSSPPDTPYSTSSLSSRDSFDEIVMGKDGKKAEKKKTFDFSYKNVYVVGGNGRKTLGGASGACGIM